jgi:hypothetical protein
LGRRRRVSKDEVRLLVEGIEASTPSWFVHNLYTDAGGMIRPEVEPEWHELGVTTPGLRRQYAPLQEPELFTSFARLAARGKPSQGRVLEWTHRYGLLRMEEIAVAEFQDASVEAYQAISLFEQIGGGSVAELRARLSYRDQQVLLDGEYIGVLRYQEPNPERTRWKTVHRGDRQVEVWHFVEGVGSYIYPEADDEMILSYATWGLERLVLKNLKSVEKEFGYGDDGHPRPLAEWRPRLVDHCPDLLTALWYQFAQIVEDRRPVKHCEMCGGLFVPRRSTKKVCGKACQKKKERRNKKATADPE